LKQPEKRLTLKDVAAMPPPAAQLTADASNEELRYRIREKAIEALNKRERLNREEWQIVSALWDRLEPKNKTPEEEKLSASVATQLVDIYDDFFAGEYCDKCHRGTKP